MNLMVGNKVNYPHQGTCRIDEVVDRVVNGRSMSFYHLAVLDDRVRVEDENPSIGIILCKEKTRTIVEYALKKAGKGR